MQKEENDKKNNLEKLNQAKQNEIENFKKVEDGIGDTNELQYEENVKL